MAHLRLGNAETLSLTTGEPFDRAIGLAGETHQPEGRVDPIAYTRLRERIEEPAGELQCLPSCHVWVEQRVLGQIADPTADGQAVGLVVETRGSGHSLSRAVTIPEGS